MNPESTVWSLLGWVGLTVIAVIFLAIGLYIGYELVLLPFLHRFRWARHRRKHQRTRKTPPAAGQVWRPLYGISYRVTAAKDGYVDIRPCDGSTWEQYSQRMSRDQWGLLVSRRELVLSDK